MAIERSFPHYALLGSGKVARHFAHYLQLLNLSFSTWSRRGESDFVEVVDRASHVLIAVSDPAIEELATRIPADKICVHFSGGAQVPGVLAAHPLMTFGSDLQTLDWYQAIPFVIDPGKSFTEVLPGWPNLSFTLNPEQRALYHALCALAGNSTFLFWQKIGDEFRRELNLPAEVLAPFLHQVVRNALPAGLATATGPVARGDWMTVQAHLSSLRQKPFLAQAYRQFLNQAKLNGQRIPEALL